MFLKDIYDVLELHQEVETCQVHLLEVGIRNFWVDEMFRDKFYKFLGQRGFREVSQGRGNLSLIISSLLVKRGVTAFEGAENLEGDLSYSFWQNIDQIWVLLIYSVYVFG